MPLVIGKEYGSFTTVAGLRIVLRGVTLAGKAQPSLGFFVEGKEEPVFSIGAEGAMMIKAALDRFALDRPDRGAGGAGGTGQRPISEM